MKQLSEAIERVLRKMPKEDLINLTFYAEERGLDGIAERGGKDFRKLAREESVELTMSLSDFISEANDIASVVANIGVNILTEEDE